jgi:cyclopropane fatty-acyl-phospholipid synthase-like methyltransferase
MNNYSPSSERNKGAITEQLKRVLSHCENVIEIGSGSGQHVIHFAQELPHITWQPADLGDYFDALALNLTALPDNILAPKKLDLSQNHWLADVQFDAMFSANCLHIMGWQHVVDFFVRARNQLSGGAILCVYGPFRYNGEFTSASNADFQQWLTLRDPDSGIRDFEAVNQQAANNGFTLLEDVTMPANNQLLVWQKQH